MSWGHDKRAGFALAAVLAGDRGLDLAGDGLPAELREELERMLPGPALGADAKAELLRGWLAKTRPPLDASAQTLPGRMRALLAPSAPAELRTRLRAGSQPARAGFAADEPLLAALLRIARCAARSDRGETS